MTKKELIEALKEVSDDTEICIEDSEFGQHYLREIEINKNQEGYIWGVTLL